RARSAPPRARRESRHQPSAYRAATSSTGSSTSGRRLQTRSSSAAAPGSCAQAVPTSLAQREDGHPDEEEHVTGQEDREGEALDAAHRAPAAMARRPLTTL